jgi:Tol biopolymer transport system component
VEGALGLVVFATLAALLIVATRLDRRQPMTNTPTPTSSIGPRETMTRPYFLDLRTGDTTPLPTSLVVDQSPAHVYVNYSVSPAGTRQLAYGASFAFESTDAGVMRVGTIDGTAARTLHVPEGRNGYLPRWSPDGTTLVFQLREGGTSDVGNIFLEDVSTGRRTQLTHLDTSTASSWFLSARFTPDGTSVVFHQRAFPCPSGTCGRSP